MERIQHVTVDFADCKRIGDIHRKLKNDLIFPEFYGANLDALWDCLIYFATPANITLKGLCAYKARYPEDVEDVEKIIQVFNDAVEEDHSFTLKYEE